MDIWIGVIGGVGLFLLGMMLLTDGLKAIAGDALKRLLSRFTGGTFSSILSGSFITAIIQSSSATTVLTIGFVSAGLLTFMQSIGVILGANIGSTSTGWIVSLIGLKINMTTIALPVIGIGVLLKLFSKGKLASYGIASAGFGLIFLGIDVLQQGMSHLADAVDLTLFADYSLVNLLILIVIGIVMTVVMQSSSAAVVTTLAALYSGAIVFEQAAALVIGQNIGTTVTAAIASIGASTAAKRTALTHISFNLLTGLLAICMLPLFIRLVNLITVQIGVTDDAVAIAIFHTLFNVVGVLVLLPFIHPFANIIIRLIPESGNQLVTHLDASVATVAPIAIEAVRRSLVEVTVVIAMATGELLRNRKKTPLFHKRLAQVESAIIEIRRFLSSINTAAADEVEYERHVSAIHVLDHLERLLRVLKETEDIATLHQYPDLFELTSELTRIIEKVPDGLEDQGDEAILARVEQHATHIANVRRSDRKVILRQTVDQQLSVEIAIAKVHALLWLDRLAYHLWRTIHHLQASK